jgi:hypothetical protein
VHTSPALSKHNTTVSIDYVLQKPTSAAGGKPQHNVPDHTSDRSLHVVKKKWKLVLFAKRTYDTIEVKYK